MATCAVLVSAIEARAEALNGDVTVTIMGTNTDTGQTMQDEILVPIQTDGSFSASNVPSIRPMWEGSLDNLSGNADPFANLAFSILNVAAVPIEYTVSVLVPIAPPLAGATLHGGSTGGSVTDADGSGTGGLSTITSVAGVPFYQGQIDGTTVLSIYPDPTSFPITFSGQTVTIPALNPGLPGPTLPSGPALASIGIVHRFLLSPGDSVATTSFFQVVPEPSSIALASISLLTLVWYGVRRRHR
ncbi:MAG: PEP-CTERM sorting domain-containing protein [Planctomycetota bacterium]|nr:MAG: PEP-CTERM sorting domain-containing protein [Planctomycetota bacterium]